VHALLAALLLSAPAGPRTFSAAPGSTLSYRVVHKFHSATGISKAVEGKARLHPDGTVQVMVRAPVESFDSGNASRDAHMREAVDAAAHPFVVFKGLGSLVPPPSAPGEAVLALRGELTFKGRTRPVEVSAAVRFETEGRARVEASFPVSLEAFEVERPSLLFVRVDDRIDVAVSLTMEVEP
jgi:polyisoprenoid-binding protein YceI